ncbi:Uu.00g045590.m01.CDS01 [Anthostomella pinea]|uniref:Uu.00g045590.m01.CDS01 n=1 Tax=Anthostomella pinea TaxID=933095 RepID=A0AAI8YEB9_9PEZI|nr:Uu.00g045590.m01.CDS01 [Anthostomella pinea]
MRHPDLPDSPPASPSPSLQPDLPAVEEDAYMQNHLPETSSGAAATVSIVSHQPDTPVSHQGSYHWSTAGYTSPSLAHVGYNLHGETDEQDGADDHEDDDHDMVDLEEGGAPLTNFAMDDDPEPMPLENAFDETEAAQETPANTLLPVLPPPTATLAAFLELAADHVSTNAAQITQQPQQGQGDANIFQPGFMGLGNHPPGLTSANPGALGPENPNVHDFLELWREHYVQTTGLRILGPPPDDIDSLADPCRQRVEYRHLKGDEHDIQGINWQRMGITRDTARKCRLRTFQNYTNKPGSDARKYCPEPDRRLPQTENYFRFSSMDLRHDVRLLHFQLRNILGCHSRTRVFYPTANRLSKIREVDPTTGRAKNAMVFDNDHDSQTSTLATGESVLIAGSFHGTYHYRHLEDENTDSFGGRLTDDRSGITNHVQIHSSRHSSSPVAAFASNDFGFRVLDLTRNTIISEKKYEYALNCSALSPDKRLRVVVGDSEKVLIMDAESGEILQNLEGHRDYGFACDWAPDGWTVATGNQDKSIRIWDARKWTDSKGTGTSVAVIRSEIAGARGLHFSPLGSGKRILAAAEEADFINLIDAQTFNTKQTVDIFGELGGISFTSGGQELIALSSDMWRGGILRLERCDAGAEDAFNYKQRRYFGETSQTPGYDWLQTPQQIVEQPDSQMTLTQKRRQAAMSEDWLL